MKFIDAIMLVVTDDAGEPRRQRRNGRCYRRGRLSALAGGAFDCVVGSVAASNFHSGKSRPELSWIAILYAR
jgi:hypothetical protein